MKITFFCKIDDAKALRIIEFYNQDLEILEKLGHEIVIATSYKEIDWKSDVIFIWWWTYAFFPIFLSKIFRKKTIITGTFNYRVDNTKVGYYNRPLWQRLLIRYSIRAANSNIMVSKTEYDLIKHDWALNNLVYSPHVIDTEKYKHRNSESTNEPFIFSMIWTGKENLKRKCLPEIIESAKIIFQKNKNVKFLIGGRKGDGFDEIQDLIIQEGIADRFILLGELSEKEKIEYMQNCIMYIQPSYYEGFGVAMAEAMSCGAAVITTDAGEVKNVVADSAILLDDCTPTSISNAINGLLSDESERQRYKLIAREQIINNFSVEVRLRDIKNTLEKL